MSDDDDNRLRARLAELKRQRETTGKGGTGGRLTPASAGERRERLRAMREKRLAQHEQDDTPRGVGAGGTEGGRSGLLRALAEKRSKDGGRGDGVAEAPERRGEFLKRVLARRKQEAPAADVVNDAERPLAGLMRRRMGQGDGAGAVGAPEDARKTRERLAKMIRKLEDRLEQLDGKPAEEVTVIDSPTAATVPAVETLQVTPEK